MNYPHYYVKNNETRRQYIKTLLKDWKPLIPFECNEAILDVGCGLGDITSTVLRHFVPPDARIVGCDESKFTVEYAKANYGNDQTTFTVMDIGRPNIWSDWKEEEFDKIFSFHCIHWIKNDRQAIVNMNSLLKPNGYLALVISGCIPTLAYSEFILTHPKWKPYPTELKLMRGYTNDASLEKEYSNLLEQCGFEIVSSKIVETHHVYSTVEECLNSCLSLAPSRENLPPGNQVESPKELMEFLTKKGVFRINPNGKVIKKMSQLEIIAKKSNLTTERVTRTVGKTTE